MVARLLLLSGLDGVKARYMAPKFFWRRAALHLWFCLCGEMRERRRRILFRAAVCIIPRCDIMLRNIGDECGRYRGCDAAFGLGVLYDWP